MSKRIVRRVVAGAPLACALACAVSCASQQTDQSSSLRADLVEVFPGVRAAPSGRYVELDARTTFFFDTFEAGLVAVGQHDDGAEDAKAVADGIELALGFLTDRKSVV